MPIPVSKAEYNAARYNQNQYTKTYFIDRNAGRVNGYVDGLEAVAQAINKIFDTVRFAHVIYSPDYGSELESLIGAPRPYANGVIETLCREALSRDDRILSIGKVHITHDKETANVSFIANTIYGAVPVERRVPLGE